MVTGLKRVWQRRLLGLHNDFLAEHTVLGRASGTLLRIAAAAEAQQSFVLNEGVLIRYHVVVHLGASPRAQHHRQPAAIGSLYEEKLADEHFFECRPT
jgi:hypothetical protein